MSADSTKLQENLTGGKKKKDEKYRKRDPRSWENVLKATANMSLEERQKYLETVYNELYNENRTYNTALQAKDKHYAQCLKEHEKDRAELSKSILARGQLESLCRELQKQNKLIKEENVARIKEEEDRRREVANTFSERLNTLTNLISESKEKFVKVKEENQSMTVKLSELYEQYQQRENHLKTVTRQLDLQKKLSETQLKKLEIEKQAVEMQSQQYEKEILLLQEKNRKLEAHVDLYKRQYNDFETTMTKSNKVFDTFKQEMSKMSNHVNTLESERNDLKKRYQCSVNSLITLSEQHVALSKDQGAMEKKVVMLQKLCRQLQEDRYAFLKQLKENNIDPVVPRVTNSEASTNEQKKAANQNGNKNEKKEKLKMSDEETPKSCNEEMARASVSSLAVEVSSEESNSSSSTECPSQTTYFGSMESSLSGSDGGDAGHGANSEECEADISSGTDNGAVAPNFSSISLLSSNYDGSDLPETEYSDYHSTSANESSEQLSANSGAASSGDAQVAASSSLVTLFPANYHTDSDASSEITLVSYATKVLNGVIDSARSDVAVYGDNDSETSEDPNFGFNVSFTNSEASLDRENLSDFLPSNEELLANPSADGSGDRRSSSGASDVTLTDERNDAERN